MITSRDRILTTHVGSLPRNAELTDLLIKREAGEKIDKQAMDAEMDRSVAYVVKKQVEAGIDIGNDGEQQRVAFQTYMAQRMTGYAGESRARPARTSSSSPSWWKCSAAASPSARAFPNAPQAVADVRYEDLKPIQEEIARVKRVVAAEGKSFAETFMTAPSPGIVSTTLLNAFYPSQEAYLMHLAGEIAKEYREIVKEGLILQIDAPDLAMDRVMFYQDESEADFVKAVERHVAAINKAIEGLPRDRIRLHICWGNWEGPHIYDVALVGRSCPRSIRPRSARSRSSSPTRATPTNTRPSSATPSPRT